MGGAGAAADATFGVQRRNLRRHGADDMVAATGGGTGTAADAFGVVKLCHAAVGILRCGSGNKGDGTLRADAHTAAARGAGFGVFSQGNGGGAQGEGLCGAGGGAMPAFIARLPRNATGGRVLREGDARTLFLREGKRGERARGAEGGAAVAVKAAESPLLKPVRVSGADVEIGF